jgi:hypothetical protein
MEINKDKSFIMFFSKNKRRSKKSKMPSGKILGIKLV